MPAPVVVSGHSTGDVLPASDWNSFVENNLNWFIQAGANLAALGASNTLTVTNDFHQVTLAGGNNIDNISVASPLAGLVVDLLFANAQTIRNNGAGTGNIRVLGGVNYSVAAGEIVTFQYNGTNWTLTGSKVISEKMVSGVDPANTVAETDLLAGAINIAANLMGPSGAIRGAAEGDWLQNSGAGRNMPRFKLKLGATTLIDTGAALATLFGASATRFPWKCDFKIVNLGATGSQYVWFALEIGGVLAAGTSASITTGTGYAQSILATTTPTSSLAICRGFNTGAVDTTAQNALVLSVILPTATATIDLACKDALVEVI